MTFPVIILIRNIRVDSISPVKLILSFVKDNQELKLIVKGKDKVNRVQTLINDPDLENSYNLRIDLAKQVLRLHDYFFDEVELI